MSIFSDKLQIGKHQLKNRAFLAPMAGITDAPFRSIAVKYGAGLVVSEMIASASLGTGQKHMLRRLNNNSDELHKNNMPHVVQLSGNEEKWLELAAKIAKHAGADIIDINFGCPSKRVTTGFAGAALMREPDKALRLIEAVTNATELPISVKMRLGWDNDNINVLEIASLAQSAGAQMIIVHARTRQQFYKGRADWHKVRPVVEALDIPVIINGDIIDENSSSLALKQSGAAGVMIGRAALGNPWIVGQIGEFLEGENVPISPSSEQLGQVIIEHYNAMMSEYGERLAVRIARKHLRKYIECSSVKITKEQMQTLLTCTSADQVINNISQLFNSKNSAAA